MNRPKQLSTAAHIYSLGLDECEGDECEGDRVMSVIGGEDMYIGSA